MKTIILLIIVVAIFFVSCDTIQDTKSITVNDLQHHNFVLISVNGISPTTPSDPNLEFGENMHISGAMCNTNGTHTLIYCQKDWVS